MSIFFGGYGGGKAAMSDGLFYDAGVLKVIRTILVFKGIRAEQDLEDAIGEVVLACIELVRSTGRPPEDVAQAIAIPGPSRTQTHRPSRADQGMRVLPLR